MHISYVVSKTSMHSGLASQKILIFFSPFFLLNQGNLPKSTLSTLSMQRANLFTTS